MMKWCMNDMLLLIIFAILFSSVVVALIVLWAYAIYLYKKENKK